MRVIQARATGDPIWSNLVILYQKGGVLRIAVKLVKFCNSTFEGISHLQIIVFTITAFRPQDFSQKRSPGDSSLGITRAISSFLLWYCNRLPLGMKRFAEKRRWSALCRTLVCDHYDFYKKAVFKIIKTCRWTRWNNWHAYSPQRRSFARSMWFSIARAPALTSLSLKALKMSRCSSRTVWR